MNNGHMLEQRARIKGRWVGAHPRAPNEMRIKKGASPHLFGVPPTLLGILSLSSTPFPLFLVGSHTHAWRRNLRRNITGSAPKWLGCVREFEHFRMIRNSKAHLSTSEKKKKKFEIKFWSYLSYLVSKWRADSCCSKLLSSSSTWYAILLSSGSI